MDSPFVIVIVIPTDAILAPDLMVVATAGTSGRIFGTAP
jgi:hypothetical protein